MQGAKETPGGAPRSSCPHVFCPMCAGPPGDSCVTCNAPGKLVTMDSIMSRASMKVIDLALVLTRGGTH